MYMLAKYSLPKIERLLNNKVNYLIPVTDSPQPDLIFCS